MSQMHLFKNHSNLMQILDAVLVSFPSGIFFILFIQVFVMHPYCNTWKKSHFILSKRSDFHVIDNLSMVVQAFLLNMLTSLSADEILLPRYDLLFWANHWTSCTTTYLPISQSILVRWRRHAGHCWRSKDDLISVVLWTPAYGHANVGLPART